MIENQTVSIPDQAIPHLSFAEKYTSKHALHYFEKYHCSLRKRLANRRELSLARAALAAAGHPKSVLDIPCGTGRFWEVLAEDPDRMIYAADLNEPMLETALAKRPADLVARVEAFQASAFDIPRPDNFVENVFCWRLLHHMRESDHRLQILKELARVSASTVVVSLWVDGNFKAWRWQVKERRRPHQNRFVVPRRVVEGEFAHAGLRVMRRLEPFKFYSMWAVYVLAKV